MAVQQATDTYQALADLIRACADGLDLVDAVPGSSAKQPKQQLHLYGRQPVSILGRKPQPTYVAGVIQHSGYTGLYLMSAYSHPSELKLGPLLSKSRSGKSCLHIKECTAEVLAEVDSALKQSLDLYCGLGWI